MADFSEEDKRILDYLRDSVSGGERYFRARQIADQIGLTAKQVGARLPRLAEESDEVEIEKWGRARSTTWRVTTQ
jgi:DNA-binding Lrp family transcriptional regulator